MTDQTKADLLAAAGILERDGWERGWYHQFVDGAICHCAEGAIAVATGSHVDLILDGHQPCGVSYDYPDNPDASARRDFAARRALRHHLGIVSIAAWNDDPDRQAPDVVAALRAAAESA